MKTAKLHGLGNSYVYVDLVSGPIPEIDWPAVAKMISDPNTGIGSDGLILILDSDTCDFAIRIFNADGSEARMCGNGIRCAGKYVLDHGLTDKRRLVVDTVAGPRSLELFGDHTVDFIRVDMGRPVFDPDKIPVASGKIGGEADGQPPRLELVACNQKLVVHPVSMGNPHGVLFVPRLNSYPVTELGPVLERHEAFPDRANIEFVEVVDENSIRIRVWERGSGETMACGTGACAAAIVSHLVRKVSKKVDVYLPGGKLNVNWSDDERVYMTGPAVEVFSGHLSPDWLQNIAGGTEV